MSFFINLKTINMKKTTLALALVSLMVFASCKKDDNTPAVKDIYNISASMSPAQETGALAGNPTGSGTVTGTYNSTTNSLTYNVTWTGLTGTATLGHFHGPALAGSNASPAIAFTLNNTGSAGNASATVTLTEAQEADLLAGKWYANIHTATNGAGEIRGQVTATLQ
jgi:hypothetical protein